MGPSQWAVQLQSGGGSPSRASSGGDGGDVWEVPGHHGCPVKAILGGDGLRGSHSHINLALT